MKKMMFLSHNWYFSVQKALIYYTFNKSHHNSFILLVFSHVANFRYVANFIFLTLPTLDFWFSPFLLCVSDQLIISAFLCDALLESIFKIDIRHYESISILC